MGPLLKPRIRPFDGRWQVLRTDYKGAVHIWVAPTRETAWEIYKADMETLRSMGMLWEIFP